MLLTTAEPSNTAPLNTRSVSPLAKDAAMLPLMLGVVSSLLAPGATVPWMAPTLSVTPLMLAVVLGAVVSRTKERAGETGPSAPMAEPTLAVKE